MSDNAHDLPIDNGPRDPHGYGIEVPPYTVAGGMVIGYVDHIHGEPGRPCPEYVPTRHELEVLARHWIEAHVGITVFWLAHEQYGSSERREEVYADGRIAAAQAHLGEAAVRGLYEAERERAIAAYHPVVADYLRRRVAGDPAEPYVEEAFDALAAEAGRFAARLGGPWPRRVEEAIGLGPPVWLRAAISDMRGIDGPSGPDGRDGD